MLLQYGHQGDHPFAGAPVVPLCLAQASHCSTMCGAPARSRPGPLLLLDIPPPCCLVPQLRAPLATSMQQSRLGSAFLRGHSYHSVTAARTRHASNRHHIHGIDLHQRLFASNRCQLVLNTLLRQHRCSLLGAPYSHLQFLLFPEQSRAQCPI